MMSGRWRPASYDPASNGPHATAARLGIVEDAAQGGEATAPGLETHAGVLGTVVPHVVVTPHCRFDVLVLVHPPETITLGGRSGTAT